MVWCPSPPNHLIPPTLIDSCSQFISCVQVSRLINDEVFSRITCRLFEHDVFMTIVNWRTQLLSYTSAILRDKPWSRDKKNQVHQVLQGHRDLSLFDLWTGEKPYSHSQCLFACCYCHCRGLHEYFSPLWMSQVTILVRKRASYWFYFSLLSHSGLRKEVGSLDRVRKGPILYSPFLIFICHPPKKAFIKLQFSSHTKAWFWCTLSLYISFLGWVEAADLPSVTSVTANIQNCVLQIKLS